MSYMDLGLKFFTEPTHNKFVPKVCIADGIRRSVEDQTLEPGARFVSEEDYNKMAHACELTAISMAQHNYKAGRLTGFLTGTGLIVFLAALLMTLAGCATPVKPKPHGPYGPVRLVSSRAANVVATDRVFTWVKFSDKRSALPVRIVDELEVSKMVPGTAVLMVKITDTAGTGVEVRGGRRGEPVLAIMIVR